MIEDRSWHPTASLEVLRLRATMLARARDFFNANGVLEVTTPALNATTVTDVNIASLQCRLSAKTEQILYLHTSPEYRMKALLAAYRQDVFQICRVYRDNELGRFHQPEFTMVEWYRQGFTLDAMIDETTQFINSLAELGTQSPGPPNRRPYAELFEDITGLNPLSCSLPELTDCARDMTDNADESLLASIGDDRNAWLDYLFSQVITAQLRDCGLVTVTHYPAAQAALARLNPLDSRIADRFEIFWDGIELANGYCELTDPNEQRDRFARDRAARRARGLPEIAPDQALLDALAAGLPACCGVALGFDRLVMRSAGLDSMIGAISFAFT